MKLNEVLYRRQYKIHLDSSVPDLDLQLLNDMGIWSHPRSHCYILTLKYHDDPNADPVVFENKFKEITGLHANDLKVVATYGPLTLQSATDSPWL